MASVAEVNGLFLVAVMVGGKRFYIRMAQGVKRGAAKKFADFAQRLADHPTRNTSELPPDLAGWISDLRDEYHAKLAKAGLVEPRQAAEAVTVGSFTRDYIDGRADLKEDTRRGLEDARAELVAYFTKGRAVATINQGDAQEFYRWMISDQRKPKKLGANTAKRRAGRAKQFFAHAVRKDLIRHNPFDGVRCRVGGSPDRLKFVTAETINTVLEQVTDTEFRAAIILARWGGLRIPSELAGLTWGDVNWEKKRLLIHVPKLEHVEGKATRLIPLFPEVEKALTALYTDHFGAGEFVFRRLRDPKANLRTQFERYILAAGILPWPKLWQNLRASRATELAEKYPSHVATAWLGHTEAVAQAHYWQTREKYFEDAVRGLEATPEAQHVAQHLEPETAGSSKKSECEGSEETPKTPQNPEDSSSSKKLQVALVGLEPTRFKGDGF